MGGFAGSRNSWHLIMDCINLLYYAVTFPTLHKLFPPLQAEPPVKHEYLQCCPEKFNAGN